MLNLIFVQTLASVIAGVNLMSGDLVGQVRVDHLHQAARDDGVVGEWSDYRHAGGVPRAEPLGSQPSRGDEDPCRWDLPQPGRLQSADRMPEPYELSCFVVVDGGLARDDLFLDIRGREAEFDCDHSLARRVFEVLEHALVPGV